MKLLIVAPHFPPTHVGGVESVALSHADWMHRAGHEVEVVCVEGLVDTGSVRAENDTRGPYTVHRLQLGIGGQDFRLLHTHDAQRDWFDALIGARRPDVLHVHSGYLTGAPALAAASARSVPTVLTLHDYWFICPRITLLQPDGSCCSGPEAAKCAWCLRTEQRRFLWADRATAGAAGWVGRGLARASLAGTSALNRVQTRNDHLRSLLLATDLVLSPSDFLRSSMIDAGFPGDRIRTHVTGIVPLPPWQRSRQGDDPIHIGYAGRLVEPKGVHVLVDAVRALPFDNWTLAIHGPTDVDPRYVARLRSLAADDSRIRFAGPFPADQQSRVFADLDALVVPSVWYENRPLIILEAQSAGLPVIASRLGGMAELIEHGRTGLLFQPGDAHDLVRQLTIVRNDATLAESLAAQRSRVMTIPREMASLESLYVQLRAARGKGCRL